MSRGSLSDNGEPHQEAIRWNMLFPENSSLFLYCSTKTVQKKCIPLHIHSLKNFALI